MAKKNYYAVAVGRASGIYSTWEQCREQTAGYSGAQYKSFSTLAEAEQYLQGSVVNSCDAHLNVVAVPSSELNAQIEHRIAVLAEDEVVAFVDGSYDVTKEKSAFGVIIFSQGGGKDTLYKAFTKQIGEEFISLRNVAAELEGVKEAISWAVKYNKRKIAIYYDYEGIEKWATGQWGAKKEITKEYVGFIQGKKSILGIEFVKVLAHSGVKFNEEVDAVAKNALLAKGHKTYEDGSVYFVGYGLQDWETIVQYINEENMDLSEKEISRICTTVETIGTREKIRIKQDNNIVTVNCYKDSKSYVQGKQTVLFEKIISTAIEFLGNKQSAIEALNSYHVLTIGTIDVENKFEQLLPNYKHKTTKHYLNLLSAVYNTMLTGYMPDYTCLVTPIFRAYEYYLHRILGDVMLLDTETKEGRNNFSFFSRDAAGLYECNSRSVNLLSAPQLAYLNTLYTEYNSVRHPYSHWSVSDVDTAVITDLTTVRKILSEGLSIIDHYYTIFET